GALFRAAAKAGALAAAATPEQLDQLERYGRLIGRAFQVTDDLLDLDERRSTAAEGQTTTGDPHEDAVNLAVRLGEEACRAEAARLTQEARAIATALGERGWVLDAIAALIEARRS
ncbi:MAG: polyprenyl synthetase family protein, partial [Myxococcota bacterium]